MISYNRLPRKTNPNKLNYLHLCLILIFTLQSAAFCSSPYGKLLRSNDKEVALWTCSSGWKVSPDQIPPQTAGNSLSINAARNETEAAQLVVRPTGNLLRFTAKTSNLQGPDGALIKSENIELLRVRYVTTTIATDKSAKIGDWPDPLPPFTAPINLKANRNQAIWVRISVPSNVPAGFYKGNVTLSAENYSQQVPIEVKVYDFDLPDRMTCVTGFGFSPGSVWKYQNIKSEQQKRQVLDKYWANFAAHHISPYDLAPLDPIRTTWPAIKPPDSKWAEWEGLRIVDNETHSGNGAALIYDNDPKANITVSYKPMIRIPDQGLRVRFWYRTAVPGHRFNVSLNHYDVNGKWLSGKNNDMTLKGSGKWQAFDERINGFPAEAVFVRANVRATLWTDAGEEMGLVWFDDVSISNPETAEEYIKGGDFNQEKRTKLVVPAQQLKANIDFTAWDKAMTRSIDHYKFNSFRLGIPGIGGGTFHALTEPSLLGFGEDDPEYAILFDSYCSQMQQHLAQKGWLDEAYVYWFDEPSPDQYGFVMNGFEKLKRSCPDIARMLTEQPEAALADGPNIYCVISNLYRHDHAQERRKFGDKFWWYVCTGPKAPYCTLFIDHPGTEMRIWLWQTWQRNIEGILVWQSNYWTSGVAYPDSSNPQNPYEDPMGWVSGYSTPTGTKRPWGNGDGRFIYPPESAADGRPDKPVLDGPVDSIRWEMLRDGIEDYEYLTILKNLIESQKAKLSDSQQKKLTALLEVPENITKSMTSFTIDPAPIEARRDEIARAIEQLKNL